jgi:hypothetical protein
MADDEKVRKVTKLGDAIADNPTEGGKRMKSGDAPTWVASKEAKGKAMQLRIFAGLSWLGALVSQGFAIWYLIKASGLVTFKIWIPIVAIVIDLALALLGGYLWKKSNRLNPPSEKNKFLFYLQSQLGVIVAMIAFIPLIVFVLTNKNIDKKTKGIIGGVAAVALLIAGLGSADFSPVSSEDYAIQSSFVTELTGKDYAYAAPNSEKYHLYEDCQYLKNSKEIFQGTIAELHEHSSKVGTGIDDLCSVCEKRLAKEKGMTVDQIEASYQEAADAVMNGETK